MSLAALVSLPTLVWAQISPLHLGTANTDLPPQGSVADMTQLPPDVERFAASVVASGDAQSRPYAVIDKRTARLWVFSAEGHLQGETKVIVGQAPGDTAPPDIGSRPLNRVRPHEKITPAGRFETSAGVNLKGEDIVWLSYDDALSMHRVRNVPGEHRFSRIQADDARQRRISFGCVNVPASFYDLFVNPQFSQRTGVVYILPETTSVTTVFPFANHLYAAQRLR